MARAPRVVLRIELQKRSKERIVHFSLDVNAWHARTPSVSQARPACCPACEAAGQVPGERVTLVGHGVRLRQVRGPATPEGAAKVVTVVTRRYRCRACGAVIAVVPQGIAARRHFSAGAIGLGLLLYAVLRVPTGELAMRIGLWGRGLSAWRTVVRWMQAIDRGALLARARLRRAPSDWPPRSRAERAAMALASLCPDSACPLATRVFVGAALAA